MDVSELLGKPTSVIEAVLAHVSRQLYPHLDPAAYMRAVEAMRQGDVVDVPALPAAGAEGDGEAP